MTGANLIERVKVQLNEDDMAESLGMGASVDGDETILEWLNEGQERLCRGLVYKVNGVWTGSMAAEAELVRWASLTASGSHGIPVKVQQVFAAGVDLSIIPQDTNQYASARLGETGTPRYATDLDEGIGLIPKPTSTTSLGVRGFALAPAITSDGSIAAIPPDITKYLVIWCRIRAAGKLVAEGAEMGTVYKWAVSEWKALTGLEV